jgi:hypothetical protein
MLKYVYFSINVFLFTYITGFELAVKLKMYLK